MKKNPAFTLIEVLIALVVFGIGFIVLLRAVIYFLTAGEEMKKRAEATLLAKEAADIIYNQRDTNLRRGVTWKCAKINAGDLDDACEAYFAPGEDFIVGYDGSISSASTPKTYKITSYTTGDDNILYPVSIPGSTDKHILTHFGIGAGVAPSDFRRTVSFSEATLSGEVLPENNILKMTVTVQYIPQHPERTVVLESYLAAGGKE